MKIVSQFTSYIKILPLLNLWSEFYGTFVNAFVILLSVFGIDHKVCTKFISVVSIPEEKAKLEKLLWKLRGILVELNEIVAEE